MKSLTLKLLDLRATLSAWCLALVFTAITVALIGESPVEVLKILALSAFGSTENLSYTLFYAAPMLLTGTAVALALEAGLFNIGAEGQLYAGAVFAAVYAFFTKDVAASGAMIKVLILIGALLFSFLGGALWGGLSGYLKTHRNTHEVISTIMLNFVMMAFANWVVLNPLKNPDTQNLETYWVAESLRVPRIWNQMTLGLPLALFVAALVFWAIRKTWWGFRTRATGYNETAAKFAGIHVQHTTMIAMALSGGIAGLVGFHEVFCNSYRLLDSFSAGYGFTGLAIALLARKNFLGLVLASLLFGALQKGALDLDLETEKITRDLSAVIQALILVALAAQHKFKGPSK